MTLIDFKFGWEPIHLKKLLKLLFDILLTNYESLEDLKQTIHKLHIVEK